MTRWLVRRAAQALVTLGIVGVLLFFIIRLTPGDPLSRLSGDRPIAPREVAFLKHLYGLDQPITTQFVTWVRALVRGDLGVSIAQGRPVTALLAERIPASLLLGGVVLLLNFTVGLALGVWQAKRRNQLPDRVIGALSLTAYATPSFLLGLLLAGLLSVHWRVFPPCCLRDPLASGEGGIAGILDVLHHLVLPAATLSIVSMAATMRQQRGAMIEALQLDCVRTAEAKGLTDGAITWHAWRNALFPVLTLFGLWLPLLVTGSVFVESVFSWPGLGMLAYDAIGGRDYPVLMGTSLLVALLVVLGGLITDIAYGVLDPRVRYR
jgi:peptide/nickel transport system permease protein